MNQPDHDEMLGLLGDDTPAAEFFKEHVKSCSADCDIVKRAVDMLHNGLKRSSRRDLERFVRDVANKRTD